jgi:hypothetical protein
MPIKGIGGGIAGYPPGGEAPQSLFGSSAENNLGKRRKRYRSIFDEYE